MLGRRVSVEDDKVWMEVAVPQEDRGGGEDVAALQEAGNGSQTTYGDTSPLHRSKHVAETHGWKYCAILEVVSSMISKKFMKRNIRNITVITTNFT